jgi:hypothetical protein
MQWTADVRNAEMADNGDRLCLGKLFEKNETMQKLK